MGTGFDPAHRENVTSLLKVGWLLAAAAAAAAFAVSHHEFMGIGFDPAHRENVTSLLKVGRLLAAAAAGGGGVGGSELFTEWCSSAMQQLQQLQQQQQQRLHCLYSPPAVSDKKLF
jgi:hypothetical protein